jgi:hypothetical protein
MTAPALRRLISATCSASTPIRSASATFFQRSDDGAQVAGHRGLQSQQSNGVLFGVAGIEHDLVVFGDDVLGDRRISVQQRLGGIGHRPTGQGTHFGDGGSQGVKLLMERGFHIG